MAKILLKMRLLTVLLFLVLAISASNSYSQQTKFSFKLENVTVKNVFQQIEDNSSYILLYNEGFIDVTRKVDVNVKNKEVEIILDQIFEKTKNTYKIYGRQIVILENENTPEILDEITDQLEYYEINGRVKEINGESISGVSILVKGTTIGTITDFNGDFHLKIPVDSKVLHFSFVGMKTQEIILEGKTYFSMILEAENKELNEVIAVGYGSQKKKDVTGSVSKINSAELVNNSPVDIFNGLQGKVAGLYISTASGELGAGADIIIRGYNSISAGTNPLIVIDGMPYDVNTNEMASVTIGHGNSSNPLNSINPADIESITVLKDASATAIYGARGANGVIIITSKSGKSEKSLINFSSTFGFSETTKKLDVLNGNEFIEYREDIDPEGYLFFENMNPDYPLDPYELKQHDWQDEILQTGFQQNYNISISGKPNRTNYYVSLGYLDEDAIVQNNNQQRFSMRMKVNHKKSEKLFVGLVSSATYSEINGAAQSGGGNGLYNGVVQDLVTSTPVEFYNPTFDPGDTYISPSSMIDDAYKKIATFASNTIAQLDYTIVNGLKLNLTGSGSFSSSKGSEFYGKNTNWGVLYNGYGSLSESRSYSVNGSAQLHYSKYFNENHNLTALLATETNVYNYEWFGVTKTNFLDESTGVFDISKGSTAKSSSSFRDNNKRVSFFGRLNYIFSKKHLVTATFRIDGSDKFGAGNRYGYFPSLAYSWLIIEEGFMQNQTLLSNAKVRFSYGASGNDRIPSHRYLARLENTYYNGELGMAANSQANNLLIEVSS